MPITSLKCPQCGKTFEPRDKRAKYCSAQCSKQGLKNHVLDAVHKFRGKEPVLKASVIPITASNTINNPNLKPLQDLRDSLIQLHMKAKANGDKLEPDLQAICIKLLHEIEDIEYPKPITIPITKNPKITPKIASKPKQTKKEKHDKEMRQIINEMLS
jgi:uncharacterized membrane protein YvbJ